jgi:subtilisin family serine protease
MKNNKQFPFPRLLGSVIILSLLLLSSYAGVANARGLTQKANNAFYYYADGNRIDLTPSLDWVSVEFASADAAEQEDAIEKFDSTVGSLDAALQIPNLDLTLLPLQSGLKQQSVEDGINSMRAMSSGFSGVNPVFEVGETLMAVTDELIATFPEFMTQDEIDAVNAAHGVEVVEPILGQPNTFVLRILDSTQTNVLAAANQYQENGIALYAAPNFVRIKFSTPQGNDGISKSSFGPSFVPGDTFYQDSWHLDNDGQYDPAPPNDWMVLDADIDAPEAWDITRGDASIVIAVVDEGVELSHVDLVDNMVSGYDATGGGSGGGPSGTDAHGTEVAGLAAALGDNDEGVVGVCMDCSIMPVRIAYTSGGNWVTTDTWIANGITWAYQNGADVINNSWGGGSSSTVINTAISNAKNLGRDNKGSVVVFAAGNDNLGTVEYPASLSTVIAVGASNMCDQRKIPAPSSNAPEPDDEFECNGGETSWGSNYGSELDVVAPGLFLDTTYIGDSYSGFFNGTSGATPIVAGVAGLLLSQNPNLTASQVQTALQTSADDIGSLGWDSETGYGRVNANDALAYILGLGEIDVTIGVAPMGSYPISSSEDWVESYNGTNGGPVVIQSNNGSNIVASLLQFRRPGTSGEWTDMTQTMALTNAQISDAYYFPRYDFADPKKYNSLQLANFDTISTTINVTIGGVLRGSYPLAAGSSQNVTFPGLTAGPVLVESDNGALIIASLYELKRTSSTGLYTGQTQMMGLPESQLSTTYIIPRYNYTLQDVIPYLVFANAGNTSTTITVTIGGILRGTYPMAAGQSTVQSYSGVNGGPVVIASNNGVNIIASLLQFRRPGTTGEWTGMTQTMALTNNQISDAYVFPRYDFSDLKKYNSIQLANYDSFATNIDVTIGGVLRGTYPLAAGSSQNVTFPDVVGGPVVVESDNNALIIASLYELKRTSDTGLYTGQTQMMGLPLSQISNTYIIPRYNYTLQDVIPYLIFSVP